MSSSGEGHATGAARLRMIARAMEKNAGFEASFEEWPIMAPSEIDEWEKVVREEAAIADYEIPAAVRTFYAETGGLSLQWVRKHSADAARGVCRVVSLIELFQRDDEADIGMGECLSSPRPFDIVQEQEFVALLLDPRSSAAPQLVYLDQAQQSLVPLDLDLPSYLDRAAEHCAVFRWQLLYGTAVPATLRRELDGAVSETRDALGMGQVHK
ncbi:hypothetical protein [Sphingosinicella sp. BN140058]|uniref:hypothetical protein n=1 Tax=Sphingosinicella sp. BN140058 TaxID=1892855 RepID=UPI001011D5C2|nr:hypothetical protein [Sphingosinicella sp. BN140058]QAY79330.1 hypothetical protein ETR14_24395 [Sphingosinicella sp. BN140058]